MEKEVIIKLKKSVIIEIFNGFEKWLKKFKKSDNDCFWYKKDILFCREVMFSIYLDKIA